MSRSALELLARCGLVLAALSFALAPSSARSGGLIVDEVQLLIFDSDANGVPVGWSFVVEVSGRGISSASFTPPGGSSVLLEGDSTGRSQSWDFESLAALQAMFPPSTPTEKYVLSVNGTETVSLDFAPPSPDGRARVTNPVPDTATTDTMPIFSIDNTCSNCFVQFVGVTDSIYYAYAIQLESFVMGPPFPSTLAVSDFENRGSGGVVSELPLGDYEACSIAAAGVVTTEMFESGLEFDYTAASLAEDCILFAVVPPPAVDEVELGIREAEFTPGERRWFMEVFVSGTGLVDGSLVLPTAAEVALGTEDFGLSYQSDPFVSVEALQAVFPPSDGKSRYQLVLNSGVAAVSLDYVPTIPDSAMTITQPVDGASGVDPMPTFQVAQACTNCSDQIAELFDESSSGVEILFELAQEPPFPSTLPFADFGENLGTLGPLSELPERGYVLLAETANEQMSQLSFTPPDDFVYYAGAYREDRVQFTVPEPGEAGSFFALGTLALVLRRRARRGGTLRYPGA